MTVSATPISLPTPFGVVTASEPSSTDPERLQSIIETKFVAWLDRDPTCSLAPEACIDNDCLFGADANDEGSLVSPRTVSVQSSYQMYT